MVRFSNTFVGVLNSITAIVSIAMIAFSIYFHITATTVCQRFLEKPLLIIGIVLLIVSVIGLVGSFGRVNSALYPYLTLMFIFLLGLVVFTVFVFVVTNDRAGKVVSGVGIKEYRLGDYSHWLRKHVVSGNRWTQIKSCLVDAQVCKSLAEDSDIRKAADFYKKKLSPIQSGCCKPPTSCGFGFVNATYWTTVPRSTVAEAPAGDCALWSNHPNKLCYDCSSCKGGVLANVKREWRMLLVINICIIMLFIIVYSVGCCATKNNRSVNRFIRFRGYA